MAQDVLIPGSSVLEVGYHSGLMACYLAATYRVHVTGYDTRLEYKRDADRNAAALDVATLVDFRVCAATDTTSLAGEYDAVFMKSVLANVTTRDAYVAWLRWVRSVLRPGGLFIAVENGRGGAIHRAYRRLTRRGWSDNLLMTAERVDDFRDVFDRVDVRHFGRVTPFLSFSATASRLGTWLEKRVLPTTADTSLVSVVVARRR